MENQLNRAGKSISAQGTATIAKMKGLEDDRAGQAKDAVSDFSRKTVESIDAQRGPAAVTLDQTASVLHQQADKVAGAAHATADTLEATAAYVRKNDMKAMVKDVWDLMRRYPGAALAVAATVGFVVARVVRPRTEARPNWETSMRG